MEVQSPSLDTVNVKRKKTFPTYFQNIFGAPSTEKFRELPASQRRYLHVYYFWVKYGFIATLYRQHSIPYQLIRDPPRLQFWLRALAPLTPMFGGVKLVEHNTRYTLFCNMIALLRGALWVTPVVVAGNYIIAKHPNGEKICDYLENDGYFIGHFIVPDKYNAKYKERARAAKYEYYLRRGEPIPLEYMPKEEREKVEQRKTYNNSVKDENAGGFQPRIAMNLREQGRLLDKNDDDKPKPKKGWFGW